MPQVRLEAEPRSDFGKGAARRLRRTGRVPAVIYGDGDAPRHISLPGHELQQALRKPKVVLQVDLDGSLTATAARDVQREVVKQYLEHVDLIVLSKAEVIDRIAQADAIAEAEAAAIVAGLDPVAAGQAVADAVAAGGDWHEAASHAVEGLEAEAEARSEANTAADFAEAQLEAPAPEVTEEA